jgi:DNA-binding transcriptional LysR family regulator
MDFAKIRYFLTLAEHLNYTKASSQLFISQSMLSRHIKATEEEFGIRLFTRNTRGVSLTPAGAILAKGLKNLSIEYDALLKQAHSAHNGLFGEIKIGVMVGYTLGRLSELVSRYETKYPDLRIVLSTVETPGALYHKLARNQIDFGFSMPIDAIYYPQISELKLFENPLRIVMSKRHQLAKTEQNAISLNDLKDETFITPADETSTAHRRLLARCSDAGFTPKVVTVPDIITVALWVEANYGVTFLHEYNAFNGSPHLIFRTLNDLKNDEFSTLYWNSASQEPRVLAFLQYLREFAQKKQ